MKKLNLCKTVLVITTVLFPALVFASDWELMTANDINELGQIIGWGYFDDGGVPEARMFLLNPLNLVPIPNSVWLLGFGLISMIGIRRRLMRK